MVHQLHVSMSVHHHVMVMVLSWLDIVQSFPREASMQVAVRRYRWLSAISARRSCLLRLHLEDLLLEERDVVDDDDDDESSDPEEDELDDVESELTGELDCVLPEAEPVPEEVVSEEVVSEEVVPEEVESVEEAPSAEASVPEEPD